MNAKIIEMLNDPIKFEMVLNNLTYHEKMCLAIGISAFKLSAMKILTSNNDLNKTE